MDAGPVAASWRLAAPHAARTQGLLVSPFAHLPEAVALLLTLPAHAGGSWLATLRRTCAITDATGQSAPAAAIGFTATGLDAMGLDAATRATFAAPFREGMHQPDRQRRLSDGPDFDTTITGGPLWSGNAPQPEDAATVPPSPTPLTVHAALLLYAADENALAALEGAVMPVLSGAAIAVARRLRLSLRFDAEGRAREHFGFADGISQPIPTGAAVTDDRGRPIPPDPVHAIALGDLLMGHVGATGEIADGPMVSVAQETAALLPEEGAPPGFRNLGLDGSYLVMRELRQDVAAFWNAMDAASGYQGPDAATALAARVVGRTTDGAVLVPGGALADSGGQPANSFGYFDGDPHGLGCPVGSHVRRAFPRDGLAPDAASAPVLLAAARNHRIMRRGRKFGPTIADPRQDDGAERGLLFMCCNTDLVRQFEFIQQTWLLNRSFGTLLDETDPLLGPRGRFTIPARPLRRRPTVETFVRFAGGEYFFLPSLPALDYLQALPAGAPR
jgi:Dyp-type peroxidase family